MIDRKRRICHVMTKQSLQHIDFNSRTSRQKETPNFPRVAAHHLSTAGLGHHVP